MDFEFGNLTDEEIALVAKASGFSEDTVRKAQIVYNNATLASLNAPISNGDDPAESELSDFIPDPSPSPEELGIKSDLRDRLIKGMREWLDPREYQVMMLRYGFYDGEAKTLEEIGEKFGVTRERIRQIEAKSLRKLKARLYRSGGENVWDID